MTRCLSAILCCGLFHSVSETSWDCFTTGCEQAFLPGFFMGLNARLKNFARIHTPEQAICKEFF